MERKEFELNIKKINKFSDEAKKKSELIDFILLPTKRPLTKEEVERYLNLDEKEIPGGVLGRIYKQIKTNLEKGNMDYETYSKMVNKQKLIKDESIGEKFSKDTSKWNEGGEDR